MKASNSQRMKYLWAIGKLRRDAKGRFASKGGLLTPEPVSQKPLRDDKLHTFLNDSKHAAENLKGIGQKGDLEGYVYLGGDFTANNFLRGGEVRWKSGASDYVRNLDKILESAGELEEPVVVYRGISGEIGRELQDLQNKGKLVGSIVEDKAFLSTSTSEEEAYRFARRGGQFLAEIEVPAGIRAVYAQTEEKELLLERGLMMEVLSFTPGRSSADQPRLTMRVSLGQNSRTNVRDNSDREGYYQADWYPYRED